MNILFLHRSFPGQFKYLAAALAVDKNNRVVFITEDDKNQIAGVEKRIYKHVYKENKKSESKIFDLAASHGRAAADAAKKLKEEGFIPDVIYGFSGWGTSLYIKEVYPDVPFMCYLEWIDNADSSIAEFEGKELSESDIKQMKLDNAYIMAELKLCDYAVCPTFWQKAQFPFIYHNKICVIHDGIDTQRCAPDKDAKFFIKDKNITLTSDDEVITYGTRGMEPYRGFPEFMEAVSDVLKRRPKAHVVIAGSDEVFYGEDMGISYKEKMLEKLDLDMSRVHFTGMIPFKDYVKMLQISSVHVYLSYPFVLSWSILDAMSAGCCIVASQTAPVTEVIKDKNNGLLASFFNSNDIALKIEYALENKEKSEKIRKNARKTVLERYELGKCLEKQVNLLIQLIDKKSSNQPVNVG